MTECAVGPCHEPRVKESSFCPKHDTDVETNRRAAPKAPMRFTSGHKLHYRDSQSLRPRPAPTRSHRRGASDHVPLHDLPGSTRPRPVRVGRVGLLLKPQFRCPGCQLTKDLAQQMPGGFCVDCTY